MILSVLTIDPGSSPLACQTLHARPRTYGNLGLTRLADRSRRLDSCPHAIPPIKVVVADGSRC